MIYKIQEIMRDVRICIDQNMMSEQLFMERDIDTLSMDDIIRSKIVDAVRRVVTVAPTNLLDGGSSFGDTVFWRDQGSGWILLPDDFLRLVIFKMSDWARPVYNVITDDDPRYSMQFSRFKGLRGTPQKPIVALVNRAEGRALEFFSCKDTNAMVAQAVYQPYPKIDTYGGIEIPERCYQPSVYIAASLALATMGQLELSTIMTNLSKQLLV